MAVVIDVSSGDVLSLASIEGASAKSAARPSSPTEQTQPPFEPRRFASRFLQVLAVRRFGNAYERLVGRDVMLGA